MKAWLRIPLSFLALVALLATLLPQTVWACPMTGRVDAAARVCQGAMPMAGEEMPCAKPRGRCCKPLSVPPSQNDDDASGHPHLFASLSHALAPSAFLVPPVSFEVAPFVAPPVVTHQAPGVLVYLARFTNSPPPLWTQFKSPPLAGRAPPVL